MNGNKSSSNTWDNKGKGKESTDSNERNTSRGDEGRGNPPDDKKNGGRGDYSAEIAKTLKGR